jgi:hypothetical protein
VGPAPDPSLGGILFEVAVLMLLMAVPAGYLLRGQIYKRGWQGPAIAPQAYVAGNVVLWAMGEGGAC